MRVDTIVLFGVLLLPSVATADKGDRCEDAAIFDDIGDKLSLGEVLMGADRSALPVTARKVPGECPEEQGPNTERCVYTDDTGLSYVVHGREVWEKEVRDLFSYSGHLIAGVDAGDSILEVLNKLDTLPKNFPRRRYERLVNGFAITTPACLHSSNGVNWDYQFIFDAHGQLISIKSASQAYWDEYQATQ